MVFYSYPRVSNSSRPLHKSRMIRQGQNPTCAFGYLLYSDCLSRWAEYHYEKMYGHKISSLPLEEREDAVFMILGATIEAIPLVVYKQVPGLPQLRRRMILMDAATVTYLFVLQDDSTPEALHSHVSQEDLDKMAEVLKITGQKPNWYSVKNAEI